MVLIEINHLVKKYGEHVAVDDLTLTVEPGKIYGFLGPNGAGKSTTMNMITGYLGATSGEVKINGHDIFADPQSTKNKARSIPLLALILISEINLGKKTEEKSSPLALWYVIK